MILLIDNYDSFTYNLAQYLGEANKSIKIISNDYKDFNRINFNRITHIVISPGPGMPDDSKLSLQVIKIALEMSKPLLGICLGHQAIIENFGGSIINAFEVCHGKVHSIKHDSNSIMFNGIKNIFQATRYHSLVASKEFFPDCLEITAKTKLDNEIMAVQHRKKLIFGFQFHPESIETQYGLKMIENFINAIR